MTDAEPCDNCGGDGSVDCDWCGGSGKACDTPPGCDKGHGPGSDDCTGDCDQCDGTGTETCDACSGDGEA